MKRVIKTILCLLMFIVVASPTSISANYTGNGTESDPYVVTTEADLKDAISKATDGSFTYIKLGNDITLTGDLDISYDKDVVIDGGSEKHTLSAASSSTIRATSTMEFRNLNITGTNYKFLIQNTSNNYNNSSLANVKFRNCSITDATPSLTNGYHGVFFINSWSSCQPIVNFIDCSISAEGSEEYIAGIMFSAAATDNGGGTLNITNTDITVNGTRSSAIIVYANGADVNISGGTFTNTNYYGIDLRSQNAQVDISGTVINSWCGVYFNDYSPNWPSNNNTVNLNSGTVINSNNPHNASGGYNNFGAIVFNGSGNVVNLNEGATINTKGTTDGDYQFAALYQSPNDGNTLNVNGKLTLEDTKNNWYFGAVTAINQDLDEHITIGEAADIDGVVLEKAQGEGTKFYHAYKTLEGALTDAEDGDTIILYTDIDESITVSKEITIDTNDDKYSHDSTPGDNLVLIKHGNGLEEFVKSDKPAHNIAITQSTGGSVTSDYLTQLEGEKVTLTLAVDSGYYLVGWDSNVSITKVDDNTYTFTMPSSNASIRPVFRKISVSGPTVETVDPCTERIGTGWVYDEAKGYCVYKGSGHMIPNTSAK